MARHPVEMVSAMAPARVQKTLAILVLVGLPLILTFVFYRRVLETDRGFLHMYDDAELFAQAANGLSVGYVLLLRGYHFLPVVRVTFWALPRLFGDTWTPYAICLLAAHAFLSASVGLVIFSFTRSLVLGACAAALLALSRHFALGVLYGAVYINVYAWLIAILIVVFPAIAYARRPTRRSLAATCLVVAFALFSLSSGLLASIGAVIWYTVGRFFVPPERLEADERGSARQPARRSADLWFLGSVGGVTLSYLILHAIVLVPYGFHLPTEMIPCGDPVALQTSMIDRFLYTMSHGVVGLVWVTPVNSFPYHEGNWRFLYPSLAAGLSVFAGYKITRYRPAERYKAMPYAAFVAFVALHVGSTLMLILGRGCPPLDHMRYNAYVAMFGLCSVCMVLSWIMTAVPRLVRLALTGAVIVLAYLFIQSNVAAIMAWTFYADYFQRTS